MEKIKNINEEFSEKLYDSKDIFYDILKLCGDSWLSGCGSYLFEGQKYEYSIDMYNKQKLLYEKTKNKKTVLEIGTYMGHSLLIMLLANPELEATCIDIASDYSKPATDYLQKMFPLSKINFICGNSLDVLPTITQKFELFHIDGSHEYETTIKEFYLCYGLKKEYFMEVIFDDIDCCLSFVDKLNVTNNVMEKVIPDSKYRNGYLKICS